MDIINILVGDECVCDGKYQISVEEMNEMISDSGLSKSELENLYNSKYEKAMRMLDELAYDFSDLMEKDFSFKDSDSIQLIVSNTKRSLALAIRCLVQAVITLIAAIGAFVGLVDRRVVLGMIIIEILAILVERFLRLIDFGQEIAASTIIDIEDYYADRMSEMLSNREQILNSVMNTYTMFDCIKEMIGD